MKTNIIIVDSDVFFKDEGDFFTIGFQSEKAKNHFEEELYKNGDIFEGQHGSKELPKLDIPMKDYETMKAYYNAIGMTIDES